MRYGLSASEAPPGMTTHNTTISRFVSAPRRPSVSKACATALALIATGSLLSGTGVDPMGLVMTGLAQTQQPLNPVGGQPGGPPVAPKPGGPLAPSTTT